MFCVLLDAAEPADETKRSSEKFFRVSDGLRADGRYHMERVRRGAAHSAHDIVSQNKKYTALPRLSSKRAVF
ncbi:hypothetical protein HMPREF9120_02463, partial [Neisseria sp. oral taxon 020 str. F0370]